MQKGAKGSCLMKKTRGQKSRDTVPLICIYVTTQLIDLESIRYTVH
jgi:hypothetical protein